MVFWVEKDAVLCLIAAMISPLNVVMIFPTLVEPRNSDSLISRQSEWL